MKHLKDYISLNEKLSSIDNYILIEKQLSDVNSNWHPEEGLFLKKDPKYIADYLIKNSKDLKQAMSRLVFYMNRAGENLENKTVLNKAKELIHNKVEENK